eukprot:CAMPEP_0180805096 /NCGR_PEP_ID=MMETSP1038_2-20121128/61821_1 /TAXON_ID=632150 /ORGANISM="Azadinium spinosum, Strain 3D9" /LENGTH=57 /DNA_ID=CAMNT_0022845601 /DNA_START=101 /DNA_END=271 /DNA_ORIENTATION=+
MVVGIREVILVLDHIRPIGITRFDQLRAEGGVYRHLDRLPIDINHHVIDALIVSGWR